MRGSRNFHLGGGGGGGGGGSKSISQKSSESFFLVRSLSNTNKTIIFQGSRGGPTFSRGDPTFSRGGGGGPIAYYSL